jgi:flagellar biosynthesis/type III secretory pathway protein FliH
MAIRIIKQNSADAERAQSVNFCETQMDPERDFPDAHPEAGLTPVPQRREPTVPAAPALDLEQIENAAFENGYRQGEKAGILLGEKRVEGLMQRYADAVVEIGKLKPALYTEVEREVVRLALEIAKKIVYREIQADREIIQALIKVALSHVAGKSAVTVHLHPTDYTYVLEHRGELTDSDSGCEVVLLADKSIERGGCLVQTECGDIDARIEERFREVERGFFDDLK